MDSHGSNYDDARDCNALSKNQLGRAVEVSGDRGPDNGIVDAFVVCGAAFAGAHFGTEAQRHRADTQIRDIKTQLDLLERQESLTIAYEWFRNLSVALYAKSGDEPNYVLSLEELKRSAATLLKSGNTHFNILAAADEQTHLRSMESQFPAILNYLTQPTAADDAQALSIRQNDIRAFNEELAAAISILRGREIAKKTRISASIAIDHNVDSWLRIHSQPCDRDPLCFV